MKMTDHGGSISTGEWMYSLAHKLFPICRSLTGDGVRRSLRLLQEEIPDLQIREIPSGTACFDWVIPDEWNIHDAYVMDESGNKIINFQDHNLHVVGYSLPVHLELSLDELSEHLYTLPALPHAIPYVTSYYGRRWGFCLTEAKRLQLKPGRYVVHIDATLKAGSMTYGELLIPGKDTAEVLLSTYICHPSMANNELSGPVVTSALAKMLLKQKNRRHSYRILFLPETIGAIAYLSLHLDAMKSRILAGFVINCVGDNRTYSFLPSRLGETKADKVAKHVLKHMAPHYKSYSFSDRGSDERQYCSPGVDLPVVSIMRSKYGEYPEYHTSLDDMSLISAEGLAGAFEVLKSCLNVLEENKRYLITTLCEPQLGKRGLYPSLSTKETGKEIAMISEIIAYTDGSHDLIDIAERIGVFVPALFPIVHRLCEAGLLKEVEEEVKIDKSHL